MIISWRGECCIPGWPSIGSSNVPRLVDCLVVTSRGKLSGTKAKFEVLPMAWPMLQNCQATSVNAEGPQTIPNRHWKSTYLEILTVCSIGEWYAKSSRHVQKWQSCVRENILEKMVAVDCRFQINPWAGVERKQPCCTCYVGSAQAFAQAKMSEASSASTVGPTDIQNAVGQKWEHIPLVTRLPTAAAALSQSFSIFLNLSQAHWHGTNTCMRKKTWSLWRQNNLGTNIDLLLEMHSTNEGTPPFVRLAMA